MKQETVGTVVSVTKQWWCKVNRKPVRLHPLDGACFPYVIKVTYTVEGRVYTKRKWIGPGRPVSGVGSDVKVRYPAGRPSRGKVL